MHNIGVITNVISFFGYLQIILLICLFTFRKTSLEFIEITLHNYYYGYTGNRLKAAIYFMFSSLYAIMYLSVIILAMLIILYATIQFNFVLVGFVLLWNFSIIFVINRLIFVPYLKIFRETTIGKIS